MPIDHVALLVRSAAEAARPLSALGLDVGPAEDFPGEGTREIYVGGPEETARLLLMQPLDGKGSSYARALRKRGPGLHHIGMRVPDLEAFCDGLAGSGWMLLPQSLRTIRTQKTAWLGRPGVGCLLEVSAGKPAAGTPLVAKVELPLTEERLLKAFDGGVARSPDKDVWLTLGGKRWRVADLAK